jgi:fido (protein-threonine AMPylation protein)
MPSGMLNELIFSSSDKAESRRISGLLKEGKIRKIAPRIYSRDFDQSPSELIRRNWYHIISRLFPGALMSHRSALEFRPTAQGHIFLTYTYSGVVSLPGLTIHLVKGPAKGAQDGVFFGNLYVSGESRAFLENLQQTRKAGEDSKCLGRHHLEEKLELVLRSRGEQGVNSIRDQARIISGSLAMEKEFEKLDHLISAMLTTGNSDGLKSEVAIARAHGEPYDTARIKLFEKFYEQLSGMVFPEFPAPADDNIYKTTAFFEGYFSNYIEGTEFSVREARDIIASEMPIPSRENDSHDILGTYRIVSDKKEMAVCPASAVEFLQLLRDRHAVLLQSRHDKMPGVFKDRNNRAGNTEFVDRSLVNGTLKKGFEWYQLLRHPFARAVYLMFLISEVHPFLDGNGRIARVMMNAELSSKGLTKIIIPTVYREDYMLALRKLTRRQIIDPYIRMMARAWHFSSTLTQKNIDEMERYLISCDAFKEPEVGRLKF